MTPSIPVTGTWGALLLAASLLLASPAMSKTHALEGQRGQNLRVWMSADDTVCGRIFPSVDRAVSLRSRAEDIDDVFVKWRHTPEIKSAWASAFFYAAEADIDNDGVIELLVRQPYSDRSTPYGEDLDVFSREDYAVLVGGNVAMPQYAIDHAKWRLNLGFSGDFGDKIIPKKNAIDHSVPFIFGKSRPLKSGRSWIYREGGEVSSFILGGQTYVLINQPGPDRRATKDWFADYRRHFSKERPSAWGGVLRFHPDGTAEAICHFQPNTMPRIGGKMPVVVEPNSAKFQQFIRLVLWSKETVHGT